jgi:SSS family solute:Na+ symporter
MSLHLVLLLSYSVLLIAIGLWVGRLVTSAGDFFVARRRLGAGLLFSTVLAANIGAGSTVGATGLGYRDGLSAWWWNGSAAIGSLVLALWIGPRIWRAASRHGFFTVGDFLESRYGPTVRGIVAVLIWFATLSILAGQLIGLAWILNVVTGLPKATGCLIGGAVITTYFAAGGLLGSAWINLIQLVVLAGGFALALPLLLQSAGGLGAVVAGSGMPEGHAVFWSGPTAVARLALLVPAFIVSPGLLQKAFGARDERAVRSGIGWNAIVLLLFAFVPALLGMAARIRHPGLAIPELALPTLFMHDLPAAAGALALAAVFSAEISTADAILFMLATSLSQDIYRRFLRPAATDRQVLRAARLAAVGGGLLGVAIAVASPTIIDALSVFYSLLGVSLFVPVVAGLLTRRPGTPEALTAIAAGVAVDVAVRLAVGGRGFPLATPEVCGLAAAAVGFAAMGAGRVRFALFRGGGRPPWA